MKEFSVKKDTLVQIVSSCQNRTFAEEIEVLKALDPAPDELLLQGLFTDLREGISGDEQDIAARIQAFGSNKKQVVEPPGFWQLFCSALEDFTQRVLIAASIFSIVVEVSTARPENRSIAWIEGFAVFMAVMICATVRAVNDYQKERQFLKLNNVADSRKKVSLKRRGVLMELHQDDVLSGDIVMINQGMEIPADGYLLESNQITTDESAMTGETDPIPKNIYEKCLCKYDQIVKNGEKNTAGKHTVPSPILMSGTRILTGEGRMLVLVVGDQSCLGKIRALLSQDEPKATPLQMKLQKIAEDIGRLGLFSAIAIVVVLLVRFGIEKAINPSWDTSVDLVEILNYFILGITVIVVAIPEGLPLAVTLSLAFSVKKMLVDNNLVRRMEACETMGGANTICSDKTGTLTMNKMTLTTYWNGKRNTFNYYKEKLDISEYMPPIFEDIFKVSACVNSTALLRPEPKGSSTEQAILKLIDQFGMRYESIRDQYPTQMKIPFSSKRKRMSSVFTYKGEKCIFVKGASEIVLDCCSYWLNQETMKIEAISNEIKYHMLHAINSMAEESLRTLCMAYKPVKDENLVDKDEKGVFSIEKSGLVLIAILGVKDIPRPEVPDAIVKCKRAGIKVRMVTGDNIVTARAIAKEVGIIEEGQDSLVMEGVDFIQQIGGVVCKECQTAVCDCQREAALAQKNGKKLRVDTIKNKDEFKKITDRLDVLARSRPEDKYALVTGLLELGNVVAVTGDGTNDAPALKKADVGFAMGINGTEVARGAAAIILLDDNFQSIVKAVMWGRNIYDSIKKFIQFQLTVNIVAVGITLVGAAILKQEILRPIQMLWINLIMDTLASLALATEPPSQELLDRTPHKRDEYIISKKMFKHIIIQALLQFIIVMVLAFAGDQFIPEQADSFDQTLSADGLLSYKYTGGVVGGTVRSGRNYFVSGGADYMTVFNKYHVFSRHFTFIFNTFVMMQVFNFLNSRKLNDEKNIFEGITSNSLFIIIVGLIMALQILLVTFGSIAFGVYAYFGLTFKQWLISIAIGSLGIIVNFVAKFIPQKSWSMMFGNKESDPLEKKSLDPVSLKRGASSFMRNLSKNQQTVT